jgi:hypothetical protein
MFNDCPRTNELLTVRLVCVAHDSGRRYNPYVHFENADSAWFWERARTLEHGNAPTSMLVAAIQQHLRTMSGPANKPLPVLANAEAVLSRYAALNL